MSTSKIWVYVIIFNEENMIPYFLMHYDFADKIIVYDNYSTDNGPNLLRCNPKVEIRYYDSQSKLDALKYVENKNNVWKEAKNYADWVIVVDMDEFVYHPFGVREFLSQCGNATIVPTIGYNMANLNENDYLDPTKPLTSQVLCGHYYKPQSKTALFSPQYITEMNYSPGCHVCSPHGIVRYSSNSVLLLHYRFIFGIEYMKNRYHTFKARLSDVDKKHGFGSFYNDDLIQIENTYKGAQRAAIQIINNPDFVIAPEINWKNYLDRYPDLRENGITTEESAILHYEVHGRREGRNPL